MRSRLPSLQELGQLACLLEERYGYYGLTRQLEAALLNNDREKFLGILARACSQTSKLLTGAEA